MTQPPEDRHPANLALIEDAQFLFSQGVEPPEASQRLGVQVQTLRTNFWRANIPWPFTYDMHTRSYSLKASSTADAEP